MYVMCLICYVCVGLGFMCLMCYVCVFVRHVSCMICVLYLMYVLGWVSCVLYVMYVFLCELAASPLRVHVYISACVLVCMCVYVNTRICVLPYMYAVYVCLICCVAHARVHVCVCVLVCACPRTNPPIQPYRYTLIIMTKFASNPTSYPPPHINLLPPNKQHRVSIE